MIKSNLPILMAKQTLRIKDVHEATGITRNTIAALYYGRGKGVQFDTIERLCRYFRCTIGELLEYQEDVS